MSLRIATTMDINISVARILSGVHFFPQKFDDLFCSSPSKGGLKY